MESSSSEYTRQNHDSTKQEGEGKANFLGYWQLELPNYWHRHDHDYEIGEYVDYGGADTQTFEVDTVAWLVLVPKIAKWCTLEDDTKRYSKVPAGDESGYTPNDDSEEIVRMESSVIEYENGQLYRHDGEVVEKLKSEGALQL